MVPGNPKGCPGGELQVDPAVGCKGGQARSCSKDSRDLLTPNPQPQLVAISQVSALAAIKPSDHITSSAGAGLILS